MLHVNHLTLHHLKDLKDLVRDLSFVVNPGDKLAIIGEEGNGKSTLLKWLMDDSKINDYIKAEGQKINHFSRLAYLPQSLPEPLFNLTLEDYYFNQDDVLEMDFSLLYQLASQLGFDADRLTSKQKLAELSGGEKIKVQLLKQLALNPDLLLLDEPSNDLDLETLAWLENFIKQTPLTVIYISHDEAFLQATATKVIHLEQLRHKTVAVATVSHLSYQDYMTEKQNKFQKQSDLALKQREEHEKKMAKYRQIESRVHHEQETISRQNPAGARLLKKKMHSVKAMGRRFERESDQFEDIPITEDAILLKFSHTQPLADGKIILRLEDETVQTPDGHTLIQSVQFLLRGKQKVGIVGKNGIGKSSLLKLMWGKLKDRPDIAAAYMPQAYQDEFDLSQTPIAFLTESGDSEERTQIMTYLASMRFTREEMTHPIAELSGGQQAKLFLLKIDLLGKNVLLLDEPTRNFSPLSQPELRQVCSDFQGAIITISHDRLFLREVCDVVYELKKDGLSLIDVE